MDKSLKMSSVRKVLPFDGCIWSYHQSTTERDIYTAAVCDGTPFRQMRLMKVVEGEKTHLTLMNSRLQQQQAGILEQLAGIDEDGARKSVDCPVPE